MLFATHILMGIVAFLALKFVFNSEQIIVTFLLVILGSVLPDIDEPHSKISKASGPLGTVLAFFFKHRGILHSIFVYCLLWGVVWYFWSFAYGLALFVGYCSHILMDSLTKGGIRPFLPFSGVVVRGPIRVGTLGERVLAVGLFVLVLFLIL